MFNPILQFKAVEKEDNGVSFMETLAMIDGLNNYKNVATPPDGAAVVSSSDVLSSPSFSATAGTSKDSLSNGEDISQLKKSLQDLQVIAEAREKKIAEVRYCMLRSFVHLSVVVIKFSPPVACSLF